ncbi:MAG TPA: Rrf2 family transcriptional regulator [Planctomycetota bacterium]|nr:Rrf2 family transcriptional regulator [Planctomycetota bacterium]
MRYSQSTELAIDSLFYMAANPHVSDFSVDVVANAQHVSVSYLAKVFQQLVKAGLLRSHRGSKGGYALGRAPNLITLRDVAMVFEGASPMYECNATSKLCRLGPKCLILATFSEAERKMHEVLAKVTLQDVVNHSAAEAQWTAHVAEKPAAEKNESKHALPATLS